MSISLLGESGALTPSVAYDGWVGAVFSALVAAFVAILVVRLSLTAERKHERERRRVDAFAELVAALLRFADSATPADVTDRETAVIARFRAWSMYVDRADTEFAAAVGDVLDGIVTKAERAPQTDEVRDLVTEAAIQGTRWHRDRRLRADAQTWFATEATALAAA